MSNEMKESSIVTAISVVGFIFGLVGLLASFVPCIGSLAFLVGVPAVFISGIAVMVAYSSDSKRTFAVAALTISLLGVIISGVQYSVLKNVGEYSKQEVERMSQPSR